MRLLFDMDKKDYGSCTHTFVRNSARGIIISNQKLAMIHSMKYDYYKFPGGGIEKGEDPVAAMVRETREEAGLVVRFETVKEYYESDFWKKKAVRNAVVRGWITAAEYEEITGEVYAA